MYHTPSVSTLQPKRGIFHVNNNGDVHGLLLVNISSPPGEIRAPGIEHYYSKYRGAETVPQLLHVGIRNSDDHAQDTIPSSYQQ